MTLLRIPMHKDLSILNLKLIPPTIHREFPTTYVSTNRSYGIGAKRSGIKVPTWITSKSLKIEYNTLCPEMGFTKDLLFITFWHWCDVALVIWLSQIIDLQWPHIALCVAVLQAKLPVKFCQIIVQLYIDRLKIKTEIDASNFVMGRKDNI